MMIHAPLQASRTNRETVTGFRGLTQIGLLFALAACGATPQNTLASPDKVGPMKKVATFELSGAASALRWSNDGRQIASMSETSGSNWKSQIAVRNISNWQSPTFKTDVSGHYNSPRTILEFGPSGDLLVTPPPKTEGCAGARGIRRRCIAAIWSIRDASLLRQLAEPDFTYSLANMPVWSQSSAQNSLTYFIFKNNHDIISIYDWKIGKLGAWTKVIKSDVEIVNDISTIADCDNCILVSGISSYHANGGIDDFRSGIVERNTPEGKRVPVRTNREIMWAGLTPNGSVISATLLGYNIAFKNSRADDGIKIGEFSFLQLWNAAGSIAFELINEPLSEGQDMGNAVYNPKSNLVAYTNSIKDSRGIWWPHLSIFDVSKHKLFQRPYVIPGITDTKRLQLISRMQSPVLAWSNDGKFLALASKNTVSIYELDGGFGSESTRPASPTTMSLQSSR